MNFPLQHMGILALLLSLCNALGLEQRACAADNCLRQIRATNTPGHSIIASSDCSSYLASSTTTVTVTPGYGVTKTVTSKETIEVISTSVESVLEAFTGTEYGYTYVVSTTIVPSILPRHNAVPTYASSCTSEGQYASACSCYGILPSHTKTVTAHSLTPPTVTKSIITTLSTITTVQSDNFEFTITTVRAPFTTTIAVAPGTFALCIPSGILATYCAVAFENVPGQDVVGLVQNTPYSSGFFFSLSSSGILYSSDSYVAQVDVNELFFNMLGGPEDNGSQSELTCSIVNGLLKCGAAGAGGANTFWGCFNDAGEIIPYLYFYPAGVAANEPGDHCYIVDLQVIYS